ncbi:MAG: hypothetical protein COA89_17180 [Acidithiobacillus sp.]|nr:MAG: hypothetical protein COA89_17180 [Acidithiobacillus sp.]
MLPVDGVPRQLGSGCLSVHPFQTGLVQKLATLQLYQDPLRLDWEGDDPLLHRPDCGEADHRPLHHHPHSPPPCTLGFCSSSRLLLSFLITNLLLGISKSSNMDYAIQKTVEAGVTSICPIVTQCAVTKLSAKSKAKK